jgi:hypothetical protein
MLEHPLAELYETDIFITGSSSRQGIASYRNLNKVVIKNLYLEKSDVTEKFIYHIIGINDIQISNVTVSNMNISGTSTEWSILH